MGARWDAFTEGPMGGYSRNRPVNVAVRNGERVQERASAGLAIAEARWRARRLLLGLRINASLAALMIVGLIFRPTWFTAVIAVGFAMSAASEFRDRKRVLRSMRLNEALLDTAT
jgi:hypothetical protein